MLPGDEAQLGCVSAFVLPLLKAAAPEERMVGTLNTPLKVHNGHCVRHGIKKGFDVLSTLSEAILCFNSPGDITEDT